MALRIISALLVATGVATVIYDLFMATIMNYNAGMAFVAVFAVVLILIGIFLKQIMELRWLLITIISCFVLLFSLVGFIYGYGRSNNADYTEDALIVLGCGLKGDKVRGQLASRLDTAVEYSRKNPNAVIVVSGGQGKGETVTEALAMERYLIDKGVPKGKIIKEEHSVSTQTNLANSKAILDKHFDGEYTVVVITGDYHIYRAVMYGKKVGLDCRHVYSSVELYNFPLCALRESAAVVKAWILD